MSKLVIVEIGKHRGATYRTLVRCAFLFLLLMACSLASNTPVAESGITLRVEPIIPADLGDRVLGTATVYVDAPGAARVEVYAVPVDGSFSDTPIGEEKFIGADETPDDGFAVPWSADEPQDAIKLYARAYFPDNDTPLISTPAWVLLDWLHATAAAPSLATPNPDNGIVGAIRWDAWVGELPTFGDATSDDRVGLVVERTLGPAHWHYRLPFYAVEVSENQVQVRGATQEIIDQEIFFAANAGLDYWAFVYYPPDSGLDLARNFYLNSSYHDAINFSLVIDAGEYFLDPASRALFVEYFNMPNYQNVLGGRPLLYIFGNTGLTREGIDLLLADAANAGLASPYIVYMAWSASEALKNIESYGLDASSAYAQSGMNGQSFLSMAREAESGWDSYRVSGIKLVPWVTTGWDPRPRIENPTPWGAYAENQWAETGTPDEIASHLQNALVWNAAYPETAETNATIIYAWNEFDEGGWLCPTLYNGTDRLDAIRDIWKNP